MAESYTYNTKEMERILKNNGYKFKRQTGSHRIYSNGVHTVPLNTKVNKMVALRIIKECNLKV